jgi:hypothetical protein
MQLDKTRIAIRERGGVDTFDLTFQVMRTFAPQLIPALLLGIIPFAVLDYFLMSWMDEQLDFIQEGPPIRYLWCYSVLVFFQAPAATILGSCYLGGAIFRQEKTLWQCVQELWQVFPAFLWCQLIMRGTLISLLVPLAVYGSEANGLLEGFGLFLMVVAIALLRALRPFINEILLLEKNPLRAKHTQAVTIFKRSNYLHAPNGGDLFATWLGSVLLGCGMIGAIYFSLWSLCAIMFGWGGDSILNIYSLHVLYPISLWITVMFMSVFRFLSYIDLRIRQEGWEVELLLKAEAHRLEQKLV